MKIKYISIVTSLLILLGFLFAACSEDLVYDKDNNAAPVITEFSPTSGSQGTEITIHGENLLKIDTVYIGAALAKVKYRISATEIVVDVTSESKTGTIKLQGINGEAESSEVFTVTYEIPTMTRFPTTAKVNEEIYIEGTNLNAVKSVLFGTSEGEIVLQSRNEIIVKVPFFEEDKVDVILKYNTADGEKQVSTTGQPFELEQTKPLVISAPSEAETGSKITLLGENLDMVDEAYFGSQNGTVVHKDAASLTVTVPMDFAETMNVELKLIYNKTKEVVVNTNFKIKAVYYWEDITISAQDPSTTNNFFNALTGEVYTPCDYASKKNSIYFFITNSSSSIQLNNPNNSENQTKNFKCDGVALPTEKMPNIVMFKNLSISSEVENELIENVKNRTIESINSQEILDAGIVAASSSTRRYYGEGKDNQMSPGDVLMFQQLDASKNVLKTGFIQIVKFTSDDPATDKKSSMTFNCYFEK